MLKGHAMKFKKRVEELKSGNLTVMKKPSAPASTPVSAAVPAVSAIQTETNLLAIKLNEIEQMQQDLESFKRFIQDVDLLKYRTILDELERLKIQFTEEEKNGKTTGQTTEEMQVEDTTEVSSEVA